MLWNSFHSYRIKSFAYVVISKWGRYWLKCTWHNNQLFYFLLPYTCCSVAPPDPPHFTLESSQVLFNHIHYKQALFFSFNRKKRPKVCNESILLVLRCISGTLFNICRGFVNSSWNLVLLRDRVWSNTWFICLYHDAVWLLHCAPIVSTILYLMRTFLIILCFFFCSYVRWYIIK